MRGRTGKGRKTKKAKKSTKSSRGRTAKVRTRQASQASRSKAAKSPARKKAARKSPARKIVAKKARTPAPRRRKEEFGEGNYAASREFRKDETGFVARNRDRIPALGEEAQAALEGDEGAELEDPEARARSRSRSPGF